MNLSKKIKKKDIEEIDRKEDKSFIRELEMSLDRYAKEQGVVIQFFKDLQLYGLDEAISYVKMYKRDGYYKEGVLEEVKEVADRIKETTE